MAAQNPESRRAVREQEASDRTEVLLAGAAASLAVGVVYGVRTAAQQEPGADGAQRAFPREGEKFGYRRAFKALGYATAIVGLGGALAVHAVCSHLDVWTAPAFAAAMRELLAGPRNRLQGSLQPAGEVVSAATKKWVHTDFDGWIVALQARIRPLLAVQPTVEAPADGQGGAPRPPSGGGHSAS